jgi:radical SAM superfamily enzyme YgiQ (UPF0313 family)
MKIAFIQRELREQFGFMLMSAKLKQAGHKVEVFCNDLCAEDIKKFQVFGFSATTLSFKEDLKIAKFIKTYKPKSFIIFGGAHPTYNPEEVLKEDCINAVCRGEGLDAIVDVVNAFRNGDYINSDIKNVWLKAYLNKERIIIQNRLRPISNIDKWPRPDYGLYYNKYPELKNKSTKPVYIVRGCPYR